MAETKQKAESKTKFNKATWIDIGKQTGVLVLQAFVMGFVGAVGADVYQSRKSKHSTGKDSNNVLEFDRASNG